ncbi:MAG TPA: protein kinase [Candidatus Krumholzibacteria bacterium]|nr:protein kinase [Candidatus Krumholzibacteria bacterium]
MNLSPGTKLGPYEILAPLGAGGMGEVYRAKDTRLGRDVAVKVLPQHLSSNPEIRARFEREAQTVSSLNHPHICTLFDVGREGDTDYLVMELIDGETLADRIAKGPLPIEQVLVIGGQVADALSRAHRAGIVHRDLKPGNIMLTKSGAKLMDFGLARATGLAAGGSVSMASMTQSPTMAAPLTAEGTIVGTFQYMSPEQLEGKESDARGDIWALGCVLYEMATGKRAFHGNSQASLIAAILEREPTPIAEIQPLSPPSLDRLVKACLAKDPDERVQTAHDVKLQLGWTGTDTSGIATAVTASARRPATRRVLPMVAMVAVLLVATTAAFLAGRRGTAADTLSVGGFLQKTYRTQAIFTARFMPDSQTLVLSAALVGNRTGLYVIRPEYPEPQAIGSADMHLLAISSRGELAVLTGARYTGHHRLFVGTLARMPLEGSAPRELTEGVREADWDPAGENLAVIHDDGSSDRLEYPAGTVLYQSPGYLSDVRVSPDGNLIAFMEHPTRFDDRGSVKVVDRKGHARELSSGYWGLEGMAWARDGSAVYYSGGREGNLFSVYRADLKGNTRMVSDNAGVMTLHDIAPDGTWAVTRDDQPSRLLFRPAGSDQDIDLSWLDSGLSPVLSGDGKTLVFTDQSPDAGENYAVALRPTAGGPMVRLGEGGGAEISADGRTVLAVVYSTPPQIVTYPVGAGKSARLDNGQFENLTSAAWLPGDARVLVSGNLPGQPGRAFVLDPVTHEAVPAGPEGFLNCYPSPDGTSFIARSQAGWGICSLAGSGEPVLVKGMTIEDEMVRWSPDGTAVFVIHRSEIPSPIQRLDLATGERETIMVLSEGQAAGRVSILGASLADDLQSVAYAMWGYTSVLFTVAGKR